MLLCLSVVGQDKPKPIPKDFKSMKALAEKGEAYAQINLGTMYDKGRGAERGGKEAVKCCRKTAEQGYEHAKTALKRLSP